VTRVAGKSAARKRVAVRRSSQPPELITRNESDGPSWVSKTDLTSYIRCPYTYWRLYKRAIQFSDTVSPSAMDLIQAGVQFEERVTQAAAEVPIETWWDSVWKGSGGWGSPLLRNDELMLWGRPDGLTSVAGVLVPIEIKSHKVVHTTDELELAFYWLLLQPFQRRRTRTPRGQLILRQSDGTGETVNLTLSRSRLDEASALVEEVRLARAQGVEPRVCSCQACQWDPDVERLVEERHHVSLIYGVGWVYSNALESLGITSYDELLEADAVSVSGNMRDLGYPSVTLDEVTRWQRHAESYVRGEPVFFGLPLQVGQDFIVLDAEYDNDEVWLIGLCVSRRGRQRYTKIWADSIKEQRKGIDELLSFLYAHPNLPVVTWGGNSADVPALRRHMKRLSLEPEDLQPLSQRHVDAFYFAWRSLRLPTPSLNQKKVERYIGVQRASSDVLGGFDAVSAYRRYRRLPAKSPKKSAMRRELVAYNRDDLRGLVLLVRRLQILTQNRELDTEPGDDPSF
jgi:predicted RecB family nuclease